MSLEDRVSIVTGSARGIGKAIAIKLASLGSKVVLFDISGEIFSVLQEINKLTSGIAIKGDVSIRSDVERAINEAIKSFGKIDVLVNNVGIYPRKFFTDMTDEDLDKVFNVNFRGTYLFTKLSVPHMIARRYGRIINIASVSGPIFGVPGWVHYCASKSAIVGFTKALALELAPFNITVNAVAPGPTETPGATEISREESKTVSHLNIPLGRLGKPEDIANVVAFLASEEASYITGQLIIVDGGYSIAGKFAVIQ